MRISYESRESEIIVVVRWEGVGVAYSRRFNLEEAQAHYEAAGL
jgi:hypothetical protein